jgi:TonB family protein
LLSLAALALGAGLLLAQDAKKEEKLPQFAPPEIAETVEPLYPPNSRAWGTVVFEVTIGEDGSMENVKVIRSIPSLTEPAERALRKWKFRPGTLDDRPVRTKMGVAFTFGTPLLMQPPPKRP